MRIGLFGGTFDPPHIGHLVTAERVRETASLDRILFVPSYISPHKQRGEDANAEHRLEMTRLAVRENPFFECCDCEVRAGRVSYTYETLETLHGAYPGAEFSLIIGMDNYRTLHSWKNTDRIMELSGIIVMNRATIPAGAPVGLPEKGFRFITVPDIEISSSEIRERIRAKKSIRYIVPPSIEEYILTHHLYEESL
jgi:nicotinate-nucleotide adenylyltransferase